MKKFEVSQDLIGKYINRCLYTDVDPVGKIVGIKGKTKVLVQPVKASENKVKLEWVAGGFAGHCVNQGEQSYDFTEVGEIFEVSLSNTSLRSRMWRIHDKPIKYYDFNF